MKMLAPEQNTLSLRLVTTPYSPKETP